MKRQFLVLLVLIIFALATGCSSGQSGPLASDPDELIYIRIRNLSDDTIHKVEMGRGRQNGATATTNYGPGHDLPFDEEGFTVYRAMDPIPENYGSVSIRVDGFHWQTVYSPGFLDFPADPATRELLEKGKYYTFEFDFEPNPKHDDRFDVTYFNIVVDSSP